MLRHADYTRERIVQLIRRIQSKIHGERVAVSDLVVSGPVDRISYEAAQRLTDFRPAKRGDQFGPAWATFWFRLGISVPEAWKGSRVDLIWDSQSEATLWIDGRSMQGLNMTAGDRPDAVLIEKARGGETLAIQIEMACNNKFGISSDGGVLASDMAVSPWHLRRCEIAKFNQDAWDLFWDAITLHDLYFELQRDGDVSEKSWAGYLLSELNRFCNAIDVEDETTWSAARKILTALYANKNGTRQFELSAIGHAHIDTAWLWPLAETDRKCERSFSTATTYMASYPSYKFACSQAYQYDVIKKRNPDLYERIKKAVKSGQWIIVGGTWIEPDCNIPSGESLVRQFLIGQRFFQREFGKSCREFWNPDVFGYNGQLPQIMRECGVTRFLTQKLSWNRFNKPQYQSFTWQGIDGSEVLAHFPPADNYNAMMTWPDWTNVRWTRVNTKLHKDHDRCNHGLMLFGWGDGGGGPTKDMLESIERLKDLQGVPRTQQRTSDEFFDLLEENFTDRPLQVGELYFEYHRGTYTSQALVKRNNRKAEILLHDLEFLLATGRGDYPRDAINKLWEVLLLNQFHDILPGSSIGEVYDVSKRQFEDLFKAGEAMLPKGTTLVNTTGVWRVDVVGEAGALRLVSAMPYAAAEEPKFSDYVELREDGGAFTLSNRYLRAKLAVTGRLTSLVHLESEREALAGNGNVFELYDDKPTAHDAWDIDPFHLETCRECGDAMSAKIVTTDPLRGEVEFVYKVGKRSTLKQTVRLDGTSRRLEFFCEVDWQEDEVVLKVAFPVNARAMNATYEMQFGVVERPTHFNTSFDLAKFEVPFHKWFDLSEPNFGVALLNDCKYGGSTFGNTMRITLLRAPTSPDPKCDRHTHSFAYAIVPHDNDWRSGVVREAITFNSPLRRTDARPTESFARVDSVNILVDTIKKAEDSDAVVIRLYECHGNRGRATLFLREPAKRAQWTDALERPKSDAGSGREIVFDYEPYKLLTLCVVL